MSLPDPVPVRFVKYAGNLPYAVSEVAWFHELQAAALIKQGFGVLAKKGEPTGVAGVVVGDYQRALTRADIMAEEESARQRRLFDDAKIREEALLRARKEAGLKV